MSPSSNSQYKVIRRGGKNYFVASAELQKFKRQMEFYKRQNLKTIQDAKELVNSWLKNGYKLEIKTYFYFEYSHIFTQKGYPKKLDVSNRIKALHDCFCDMLGIDDSLFFAVVAIKKTVEIGYSERVDVFLTPFKE